MCALPFHTNNSQIDFGSIPRIPNDSLYRLHKSGVLSDRDLIAAWDVEIACRDLGTGGGSAARVARHGAAGERFKVWIGSLSAMGLPAGPALDVILESRSLIEIDRRWRRRKGWARNIVRMTLAEYPDVFMAAMIHASPAPLSGGQPAAFMPVSLTHHVHMREVA